jgi:hypothetical protein
MENLHLDRRLNKPNARPRLRLIPGRPATKRRYLHGELRADGRRYCAALDIFCGPCDHKDACTKDYEGQRPATRWELVLFRRDGFHGLVLPGDLTLPEVFRRMRTQHPGASLVRIARESTL